MKEGLITTGFIEWCARHLAEPAASNDDLENSTTRKNETELALEFEVFNTNSFSLFWPFFIVFSYPKMSRFEEEFGNEILNCTTPANGVILATLTFVEKRKKSAKSNKTNYK